jgi:hypothetical protein
MTLIALLSGATGCGRTMSLSQHRAMVGDKIEIGMKRIEVERQLGFPQKIERVGSTTFLFYTTPYYVSTLWSGSQNPIAIENDMVVGIGKAYYDSFAAAGARLG